MLVCSINVNDDCMGMHIAHIHSSVFVGRTYYKCTLDILKHSRSV